MINESEKNLSNFSKSVMDSALIERDKIDDELKAKSDAALSQKELKYLEDAYKKIQKDVSKTRRKSNEEISKVLIEYKKKLLFRREEIINDVFNEVLNRLHDAMKNDSYYSWLLKSANSALEAVSVGDGSGVLFINASDESLIDKLKNDINKDYENIDVRIIDNEDIIGGAKAFNEALGVKADYSIKTRIEEAKKEFIKDSQLIVD